MQPRHSQLPVETDFLDPRSQDPDERYAVKMFLGKTAEEAEALFRQSFLARQEDLTYMRAPAFRFYVLPAISDRLFKALDAIKDGLLLRVHEHLHHAASPCASDGRR